MDNANYLTGYGLVPKNGCLFYGPATKWGEAPAE